MTWRRILMDQWPRCVHAEMLERVHLARKDATTNPINFQGHRHAPIHTAVGFIALTSETSTKVTRNQKIYFRPTRSVNVQNREKSGEHSTGSAVTANANIPIFRDYARPTEWSRPSILRIQENYPTPDLVGTGVPPEKVKPHSADLGFRDEGSGCAVFIVV